MEAQATNGVGWGKAFVSQSDDGDNVLHDIEEAADREKWWTVLQEKFKQANLQLGVHLKLEMREKFCVNAALFAQYLRTLVVPCGAEQMSLPRRWNH
jgi:hypothetical protein